MKTINFLSESVLLWTAMILVIVQTALIIWLVARARKLRKQMNNRSRPVRRPYQAQSESTSFLYDSNGLYYIANKAVNLIEMRKLYLNPQLKIADVSRMIGTNRNYLSKAINDCFLLNFRQLCNYFRVKEACLLYFSRPDIPRREWVEKSGFRSFSSFSSVFGSFTQRPPVQWQREVKQRLRNREIVTINDYLKDLNKI